MSESVVFCFGRFQPPTLAHYKMFKFSADLAKRQKADFKIYASHTHDNKANPLGYKDKLDFLKKSFPEYSNNIIESPLRTIFEIIRELAKKYNKITFVVGEDRLVQFRQMIKPYLNTSRDDSINVDSFQVVSAGDRDPDADDKLESLSATMLRNFAVQRKYDKFKEGLSSKLKDEDVKKLFDLIRKEMQINIQSESLQEQSMSSQKEKDKKWQSFKQWLTLQDECFENLDEISDYQKKQKEKERQPDSDYLFVNKKSGKRKLAVKKFGEIDRRLLGAAHRVLSNPKTKGYSRTDRLKGLNRLQALYKRIGEEMPE